LNLYLDILTCKIKPEQKISKTREIQPKSAGGRGLRTRQKRRPILGMQNRRAQGQRKKPEVLFAYNAVCPMVIQAIGEMTAIDTLPVLKKLAKDRPDMLGFIAIEIYKKDAELGKKVMRNAITLSSRDPRLVGQVETIIGFLAQHPSPFSFEALAMSIIKGDKTSAKFCLDLLDKQITNETLPKELDVPVMLKSILHGLAARLRTDKNAGQLLDQVIETAKRLQNPELNRIIENIDKFREKLKRRVGQKHKLPTRQRKTRRTVR